MGLVQFSLQLPKVGSEVVGVQVGGSCQLIPRNGSCELNLNLELTDARVQGRVQLQELLRRVRAPPGLVYPVIACT